VCLVNSVDFNTPQFRADSLISVAVVGVGAAGRGSRKPRRGSRRQGMLQHFADMNILVLRLLAVRQYPFSCYMMCTNLSSSSSSYGFTAQVGPWSPLLGFRNRAGLLFQPPTPNLEDQASVFMTRRDRVTQLYPQALGTHFSRLLRHEWVTVGLFFNPHGKYKPIH
jgi:hypothetical protein